MSGPSFLQRARWHARIILQRRLRSSSVALQLVKGKKGLEIGGPSALFQEHEGSLPLYDHANSLDNVDISRETVWATHTDSYVFSDRKAPGKNIFCDGSALSRIADQSYDFVLSCHNLEHLANPVKALMEWKRVSRPNGGLILVLPHYRRTFDHRRAPTPVDHMLRDYETNMEEDDLSHLPEILRLHDLSIDSAAGTPQEFRERSLKNFSNRCLHQHVFNERNSRELLLRLGFEVLVVECAHPCHIFLLARFPAGGGLSNIASHVS